MFDIVPNFYNKKIKMRKRQLQQAGRWASRYILYKAHTHTDRDRDRESVCVCVTHCH